MRKASLLKIILSLLLSAIMVACFVACGGEDITSSVSDTEEPTTPDNPDNGGNNGGGNSGSEDLGDNNGDHNSTKWNVGQTKGQTFAQGTYIDIYVPWVSPNWFKVSYEDTNRLDRMWKAMIGMEKRTGRRQLFIHTTSTGDLYFDQDYNIRWTKQRDKVLKIFHGGAITLLKEGYGSATQSSEEFPIKATEYYERGLFLEKDKSQNAIKFSGRYVLGGLYSYALDYNTVRQWGSHNINCFFGETASSTSTDSLKAGRMELLALHPGYPVDLQTGKFYTWGKWGPDMKPYGAWWGLAFALQVLMPNAFMDINTYLNKIRGKSPERYLPFFNVTHQLYHKDFRWSQNKDYNPYNFWYVDESKNW